MATEIRVPSSLPNEMNFALPASLPAAKTFEIRVQPINSQVFTAGNVVQFDIPCNKRGQYLDPTTTYIKFKATYTATATTDISYLLGTAYSYFNKQEVYGNNSVTLETINELGVLANMLCNCQLNASDKNGLAPAFGFGDGYIQACSNLGHGINLTQATTNPSTALTFSYSIPIIGILGSGSEKMIPVGSFYSLRYELTVDDYTKFTAITNGVKMASCSLSDFEFCGQIIELDNEPQSLIEQQNPNLIHIRSQSYRTATNYLALNSAGLNDVLIGCRVSSLKSMYVTCSPQNAAEGKFASVCPNLTQGSCLVLAGQNLPQRTLNCIQAPSDTYIELQKALGALSTTAYNGSIVKSGYYTASTLQGLCTGYNTTLSYAAMTTAPSMWIMGINTEIVSHRGGLLSGININGAPSFLRCQINSALSGYAHTLYFFAYYDVILEIDVNAKTIVAKFKKYNF